LKSGHPNKGSARQEERIIWRPAVPVYFAVDKSFSNGNGVAATFNVQFFTGSEVHIVVNCGGKQNTYRIV
jgi:hypothetical protein